MLTRQLPTIFCNLRTLVTRSMSSAGDFGSGAGKGGGSGGSIREAGGSFGKMEAAHEEEYFRKLKAQQLKQIHENQKIELKYHESQIKVHKEAIKLHEDAIENIERRDTDSD